MILNKRDYLKQVFSFDLSYETEKMIAARRDFLAGDTQGTATGNLTRRQELYWQLQEFRYEFWDLSAKQRANKIEELSKQAPPEFIISLEHLEQVSGLIEEVTKLEKDLDFDPLFVERLKNRLLWSNNAVPSSLELRNAIPAKTYAEFKQIQESVPALRENYPQLARTVPQWLEMIETSEVTLDESAPARVSHTEEQSSRYTDPADQAMEELVRTQIETNRQPDISAENDEGCGVNIAQVIILLFFLIRLIYFLS